MHSRLVHALKIRWYSFFFVIFVIAFCSMHRYIAFCSMHPYLFVSHEKRASCLCCMKQRPIVHTLEEYGIAVGTSTITFDSDVWTGSSKKQPSCHLPNVGRQYRIVHTTYTCSKKMSVMPETRSYDPYFSTLIAK